MHPESAAIVAAARRCVGTRTRPQGRLPGVALDCIGVAKVAAEAAGKRLDVPQDYALGGDNGARLAAGLRQLDFHEVDTAAPGDIAEIEVAPGQRHLAVLCGATAVHAHFGVGRVVEAPLPTMWTIAAVWRLPETE